MKKILLFSFLFFSNILFLSAECSYKELKELSTLASYIDTHYVYNEKSDKFDLTILNIPRELFITSGQDTFSSNGEEIVIKDLAPGTQFKGTVVSSSGNNCSGENLRTLTVNIPYKNTYYGDARCKGHENLDVCSNKFLDYQISNKTFNKVLPLLSNISSTIPYSSLLEIIFIPSKSSKTKSPSKFKSFLRTYTFCPLYFNTSFISLIPRKVTIS